jgi:SAM-dependent methyltransferase
VAVEPVAGMRAQLIEAVPGVKALDGTAEDIPLGDGAADVVAVAQAFHWFDAPRAAAEIHRVLAPGGGLGVIWNAWDESVPWVARTQAIVHEFQGDAPRHATSRWRSELDASGLFTLLAEHQFDNLVPGDPELLEARVSSTSYIAALGPTEREAVLRRVRQVLEDDPVTSGQPQLEMPYHTHLVCLAGVTPRQKTVAEHVYPNTGCKEKL